MKETPKMCSRYFTQMRQWRRFFSRLLLQVEEDGVGRHESMYEQIFDEETTCLWLTPCVKHSMRPNPVLSSAY
jgi:hypothetical protein